MLPNMTRISLLAICAALTQAQGCSSPRPARRAAAPAPRAAPTPTPIPSAQPSPPAPLTPPPSAPAEIIAPAIVAEAQRLASEGARLCNEGQYEKAEQALSQALALYPLLPEANLALG